LLNAGVLLAALAVPLSAPAWQTVLGRLLQAGAAVAFAVNAWPRVKPTGAYRTPTCEPGTRRARAVAKGVLMRILAIITGDYGRRHADNIRQHAPAGWQVEIWQAPTALPPFIDYPEDYVPADLPAADLVLALQEHKGVAELIPDVCQVAGARAVIAAVDNETWLPRGLARQLRGWLADDGVACVTPSRSAR
jgi:hypothetical protein